MASSLKKRKNNENKRAFEVAGVFRAIDRYTEKVPLSQKQSQGLKSRLK